MAPTPVPTPSPSPSPPPLPPGLGEDDVDASLAAEENLPLYQRREARHHRRHRRAAHVFEHKKDGCALKLRVTSIASSSKALPTFLGTKPIKGSVELVFEKPQHVVSVDVSVRGRIFSWSLPTKFPEKWDTDGFLLVAHPLWKADEPSKKPTLIDRFTQREGTELVGTHTFDFVLALPPTVSVPVAGGEPRAYPLPPSLVDKGASVNVVYELTATVKRGGSFGGPSRVTTQILYAPHIRPDPFPPLRQSVYDLGVGQLIGPNEDPSGWHELEPTIITGRLFGKRDVTIACTLALAKPLQYTRGSFIPLCLTLEGADEYALDLLALPSAPAVDLLAVTTLRRTHARRTSVAAPEPPPAAPLQSAVWWADTSGSPRARAGTRQLFGEIHVRASTPPAFATPELSLSYKVALLPFSTPGFVPAEDGSAPLATAPVEIVTGYARGQRTPPVSVTPPTYKKARATTPVSSIAAAFLA